MSCGYVNSQANFNMPCEHLRIYVDGKDQLWTKTKYVGVCGCGVHTHKYNCGHFLMTCGCVNLP